MKSDITSTKNFENSIRKFDVFSDGMFQTEIRVPFLLVHV